MANNVCPWWMGYLLLNPVRRFMHDPESILSKYVLPDMKVLDIGCAMGYFSLPMAKLVGEKGKAVCVDLQEKMIQALRKRSEKAGLQDRLEIRQCGHDSLLINDLQSEIDFALAFAVVHEVPDQGRLFKEVGQALKAGGSLLMAEPKGHVVQEAFASSLSLAQEAGFRLLERPAIPRSNAVLLRKE